MEIPEEYQLNRELSGLFDEAIDQEGPLSQQIREERQRYSDPERIAEGGQKAIFRIEDKLTDRSLAKAQLKTVPTAWASKSR